MPTNPRAWQEDADIALARAALGRHGQSLLLLADDEADGAAALDQLAAEARDHGGLVIPLDGAAPDALLATTAKAIENWQPDADLQRALNGFKRAHKLVDPKSIPIKDTEIGVADSGMAEMDLPDLIAAAGKTAKAAGQPVLLTVARMDQMPLNTMGTVITALHKASQEGLPVLLFGAGREALRPMPATARSYAERMFTFHTLEPSPHADQSPDPRASGLSVPASAQPAGPDHPKP